MHTQYTCTHRAHYTHTHVHSTDALRQPKGSDPQRGQPSPLTRPGHHPHGHRDISQPHNRPWPPHGQSPPLKPGRPGPSFGGRPHRWSQLTRSGRSTAARGSRHLGQHGPPPRGHGVLVRAVTVLVHVTSAAACGVGVLPGPVRPCLS